VTVTAATLGGVPTAEITVDGVEPRHVVLYRSAGGRRPGSSPSTTGSPPSTRTRQR
jgi:hypothetical protein